MNTELIIDVRSSEVAIALLEDKQLVELNKEKSNVQFSVGDIYLGKVKKIMPGLNAAFIDVGYEKDAFLHYLDLGPQFKSFHKFLQVAQTKKGKLVTLPKLKLEPEIDKAGKISNILTTGQTVLVQIAKEPISTKGPRLSAEISIAGRNIVLLPFSDKVSISQKISSIEERKRLKRLLESIVPKNFGVIVRTAAEGKKVAILDAELRNLIKKWEIVYERVKTSQPPCIIVSEIKRTSAIIRDMLNVSFNSIYVNDDSIYNDIKEYISTIAPEKEKIVKLYSGNVPIFENFGVEKQIKGLFGKTVSFKSGAYLIIEHTEALHVVDVNSGNRSKAGNDQETNALDVNLAAAEEITRQLRLRDMGGIIVVDFIDMHLNDNRQLLFDRMKELMNRDRTKHNILPLSKFGLMQITRQRVRPEMHIETLEKCPTCKGTGEIKPAVLLDEEIENRLAFLVNDQEKKKLVLKVHPFVAAYLTKGVFSKRYKLSKQYKCSLKVTPISSYNFLEYHFLDQNENETDI
ncbi:MAG: Rne/Rng family ribonuclease [Bacteroidales bacterium]|nr:Rne/Rng family ribonuclease [Bacteroidales bacterium]MDY0196690.1 Rne/Rng family ribonuclease [Tenuifilaceae bacterium]